MSEKKFNLLGIEMPLEEFDRLLNEQTQGKELKVVNGRVVAEYHIETVEEHIERLRATRKPLLVAFDKWEKAVLRSREYDDIMVMAWYRDLLDLKESAFATVPDRIKYYM